MSDFVWVIARKHKKNIFGKITFMNKRMYRNTRLKHIAYGASSIDNCAIFETKSDAENCLYNRYQKFHSLPTDFFVSRRKWRRYL